MHEPTCGALDLKPRAWTSD